MFDKFIDFLKSFPDLTPLHLIVLILVIVYSFYLTMKLLKIIKKHGIKTKVFTIPGDDSSQKTDNHSDDIKQKYILERFEEMYNKVWELKNNKYTTRQMEYVEMKIANLTITYDKKVKKYIVDNAFDNLNEKQIGESIVGSYCKHYRSSLMSLIHRSIKDVAIKNGFKDMNEADFNQYCNDKVTEIMLKVKLYDEVENHFLQVFDDFKDVMESIYHDIEEEMIGMIRQFRIIDFDIKKRVKEVRTNFYEIEFPEILNEEKVSK